MYIWFDGKVNPCDADYKSLLSFGNVNQNSIKEIWSNNSIAKLRQDHLKIIEEITIHVTNVGSLFVRSRK